MQQQRPVRRVHLVAKNTVLAKPRHLPSDSCRVRRPVGSLPEPLFFQPIAEKQHGAVAQGDVEFKRLVLTELGPQFGQQYFAVREAVGEAVERARKEQHPTLLEIRTYRFMGHSMSDAVSGTYRTKAELEEYMKRDPIALLRTRMEENGSLSEEQLQRLDTDIKAVVQDAWDFADASPELPLEALYEDVYVDTTT